MTRSTITSWRLRTCSATASSSNSPTGSHSRKDLSRSGRLVMRWAEGRTVRPTHPENDHDVSTRISVLHRPLMPGATVMIDIAHASTAAIQNTIGALGAEGQSVWQDDLNRGQLTSGELRRSIDEIGIRGLTSNPTIFAKAITSGTAYDEQIATLLRQGKGAAELFEAIAVQDVRDACDLFRPL